MKCPTPRGRSRGSKTIARCIEPSRFPPGRGLSACAQGGTAILGRNYSASVTSVGGLGDLGGAGRMVGLRRPGSQRERRGGGDQQRRYHTVRPGAETVGEAVEGARSVFRSGTGRAESTDRRYAAGSASAEGRRERGGIAGSAREQPGEGSDRGSAAGLL